MGMLAEKTHPYIKEKVVEMLESQGFSNWEAKNVVTKTWRDTPTDMQVDIYLSIYPFFYIYLCILLYTYIYIYIYIYIFIY